ncbi:hypothetical protein BDA96_05G167500 [Sorghum bicolor]|uniref:Knottin scorpion toxin-like domain-containing protein n=2 Tax=Sorghum bicolor TaxID=4558 RepID=A0A921R0A5_SORBI|nr:uncharacterized protein LOC110435331 [Sorghum bicolor]EES09943.2 hypothetical protein SORBI_3005G153100 [Sorghum bicolor]KAG0530227.1 hypothetical protein BDA96_05G167500 [Sorghum bicolor]|eukprot:XP_021316464.1 uncharacterized protein LOC110435331 [Sorghum bicolor]
MSFYKKLAIVGLILTLLLVSHRMEAAAKMCSSVVQRLMCGGSNPKTTDKACSDSCKDIGYTGGGSCDMHQKQHNTYRCICRKPCAAEQTQTHAGNLARARDAKQRTQEI